MKLNADVIYDNLKESVLVEMVGYKSEELLLKRPEFYVNESKAFLANHLYIVESGQLPIRPTIEKGAVIICIGEIPQMQYFRERCCFIKVKEAYGLFEISNLVQNIFNKYDSWSEELNEIMSRNASIEEMVSCSFPIFKNPLFVINSNFQFVAFAGFEGLDSYAAFEEMDQSDLSLSALGEYLQHQEPQMNIKEPLLLNLLDTTTLNSNLFDYDEYEGCLAIDYKLTPHKHGDIALCKYLTGFIVLALKKNSTSLTNERSVLRKVFQALVEGMPVDSVLRKALSTADIDRRYVCIELQLNSRFAQIPTEYVRNKFEMTFPKSTAFEYKSDIVTFIEIDSLIDENGDYKERLEDMLKLFIGTMDLQVGISDVFANPYNARQYYSQALAALENGNLLNPNKYCYYFRDYALTELIINAQGDLPIDLYFSEGLRHLFEHDLSSPVSYIETLRVYLDQNMSITKTATELYIHRSTLLERIARIERELGEDLKDPEIRLQIQIILKAMQIQDEIKSKD